jgi:DNA polymerase theta
VYVLVAAALLRKPPLEVGKKERDLAKTCCLGIIYGMGIKELAKRYKVAEHVASRFMGQFHEAFPLVRQWASAVKRRCHDDGFVTTLSNRRRQVPRAAPGDSAGRARAERQAVNSVVQGSASDLLKLAMVRIHRHLEALTAGDDGGTFTAGAAAGAAAGRAGARLLLQVHDELIFDVAAQPEAIAALVGVLRDCMEREVVATLSLRAPLAVKVP